MNLRAAKIKPLKSLNLTRVDKAPLEPPKALSPSQRYPPPPIERPYTDEEIIYSKLAEKNPILEQLVEALDLVSLETEKRLRKVTKVNQVNRVI